MDIREIKTLLDEADNAEASASTNRWNAAEAIVEQLDAGITQVILAEELERTQPFVSYCARVWREQETIGQHVENLEHNFQAAYRWVQSHPANPRNRNSVEPTPEPEPEVVDQPQFETDENGLRHPVGTQTSETQPPTQNHFSETTDLIQTPLDDEIAFANNKVIILLEKVPEERTKDHSEVDRLLMEDRLKECCFLQFRTWINVLGEEAATKVFGKALSINFNSLDDQLEQFNHEERKEG